MTSRPMLRSAIWNMSTRRRCTRDVLAPKGTTEMEMSAQVSAMMGARMKSGRSTASGHQVFLEEELDAVGERLQQAEGADAGGSPAVLDAAENLALQQHRVGDRREQ